MARAKISMVVVAAIVLLLLISGTMASPGSRMLLQKCNGGCAAWKTVKGGKKVCGSCCTGYYMKNGVCAKQTKTAAKGPYGGVGVARQTTVRAAGH